MTRWPSWHFWVLVSAMSIVAFALEYTIGLPAALGPAWYVFVVAQGVLFGFTTARLLS